MENELAAAFLIWQVTEFIKHHEFVVAGESIRQSATFAIEFFELELIGEVDEVEEPGAVAGRQFLG